MLVGEALRIERIKLNLTQRQFSDSICTPSNYSKIERGLHQITLPDLLLLLSKNKIDCVEFIKKIKDDYKFYNTESIPVQNLMKVRLTEAFYNFDVSKVQKIDSIIGHGNFKQELKLESNLIRHIVQHDLKSLDPKITQKYKTIFFSFKDWYNDVETIRLFSNSIVMFDNDELEYQMGIFLKHFPTLETSDMYTLEVAASVLVNYLYICYQRDISYNKSGIADEFLKKLPHFPELFVYKCLGNYYNYLIHGNEKEASKLKKFMIENGLQSFIENSSKILY